MVAEPLAGTKVVDLTRYVSGSYATMILAGLGARVLKIEPPPGGDPYRGQGLDDTGDGSTLFASLNRSKKSVLLDVRLPDGSQALELLLAGSDFILRRPSDGGDSAVGAMDPPFRIDGERPRLDGPPELGAHTRGVLEEFGVPSDLVDRLTHP